MLVKLHVDPEMVEKAKSLSVEHPDLADTFIEMIPTEKQMNDLGEGFYFDYQEQFFFETQNLDYEESFFIKDEIDKIMKEKGLSIADMFLDYPKLMSASEYIVADDLGQVSEYFKPFIESKDTEYAISVSVVKQMKPGPGESSYGGWRWHKWGPYIGKFKPKCEYLDDEEFGPEFKGYVICAHIKKVKNVEKD